MRGLSSGTLKFEILDISATGLVSKILISSLTPTLSQRERGTDTRFGKQLDKPWPLDASRLIALP